MLDWKPFKPVCSGSSHASHEDVEILDNSWILVPIGECLECRPKRMLKGAIILRSRAIVAILIEVGRKLYHISYTLVLARTRLVSVHGDTPEHRKGLTDVCDQLLSWG